MITKFFKSLHKKPKTYNTQLNRHLPLQKMQTKHKLMETFKQLSYFMLVFISLSCAKKTSTKTDKTEQLQVVQIDFDKIDAEKRLNKNEESNKRNNQKKDIKQKKQIKDTIIWQVYLGSGFKRMFYGKVKSSEEVMYYMYKDAHGNYTKSTKRYYKRGIALPWNFKVEFDSLGRHSRRITFTFETTEKNIQKVGSKYIYNNKGKLLREKKLKKDRNGFFSVSGNKYGYSADGKQAYRLLINHDDDDKNMWTEDSLVFKYNTHGDLIDSQYWKVLEGNSKLELVEDYDVSTIYKYDKKGRVLESIKKDLHHWKYTYKNGKLASSTMELHGATNEYEYYPTGIIKRAKLRTTMSRGDFEFNEFGQIEFLNGKRVAKFFNYDAYGNWTERISYKENGVPETYTKRIITYY